jgi:photosystem II stability/assembly factor-like uncharacterized protein
MIKVVFALLALLPSMTAAQWTPQTSGTAAEFRGLAAVSPTVVWASGTQGRIARTTNGGVTWTVDSVAGAARLDFRDIAALSARRAWAMSAGPGDSGQVQIFRTHNGGARWTKQFDSRQSGVFLDAISFWDANHGISMSDPVGGKLFILTTDNGGKTWKQVNTDKSPPVLPGEAAFAASGTCMAIQGSSNVWIATGGGPRSRVFHSADRGRTWTVADTPVPAANAAGGLFSVAFMDARHGAVVGGRYDQPTAASNNVALSDDGGKTWRTPTGALPLGYMSGVAYVPGTGGRSLVAVGLGGTAVSADRGESWTMVDSVGYNSVAFASKADGWAVGPRGRISKWTPSTAAATKP